MLLVTFTVLGFVFNLATLRYIENSAVSQIDSSHERLVELMTQMDAANSTSYDNQGDGANRPGNSFRITAAAFIVDAEYSLVGTQNLPEDEMNLLAKVKDQGLLPQDVGNLRLESDGEVYYVSGFHIDQAIEGRDGYWLIYANVTGLSNFAATMNGFFVLLVGIVFAAAICVTFFLSGSITRPIRKLAGLADDIGRGDFTPRDFGFSDVEFADLNLALNQSARQLDIYDGEQKTFFQNASHELRTPLMSIQCHAEGISCGIMEPKQASTTILAETARLTEMVKDLLYISKIDNITTVYTSAVVDLTGLIRECADSQQAVAQSRGVHFTFDMDPSPVECDCVGELVARAVENLMSNALRYASSEVVLSCHANAGEATICVSDDGPGISPEALPHVFERFYKGTGGNYGIGLSIVKSIVDQHQGRVDVANTADGGACFCVTLPTTTKG